MRCGQIACRGDGLSPNLLRVGPSSLARSPLQNRWKTSCGKLKARKKQKTSQRWLCPETKNDATSHVGLAFRFCLFGLLDDSCRTTVAWETEAAERSLDSMIEMSAMCVQPCEASKVPVRIGNGLKSSRYLGPSEHGTAFLCAE